jgi:NAD-dependent dihydropyrimidine dehydrogenase PreA subunit
MINVDQALCAGCGVCINACPTGAIYLSNDKALVDPALCDGCGEPGTSNGKLCVEICPDAALTWVTELIPENVAGPFLPAVVEPSVAIIPAQTRKPAPWHRAFLPAVGGALSWVGREVVPRLTPLALETLDNALRRRLERPARGREKTADAMNAGSGQVRRQRRRRRRGQ